MVGLGKERWTALYRNSFGPRSLIILFIPVSCLSYLEYGSDLILQFLSDRIDISSSFFLIMHLEYASPARIRSGYGYNAWIDSSGIQPFSQKSRTPTVAKEFQIGLYDPAEADLELFCNSWSAGFYGERLYIHDNPCNGQRRPGASAWSSTAVNNAPNQGAHRFIRTDGVVASHVGGGSATAALVGVAAARPPWPTGRQQQ